MEAHLSECALFILATITIILAMNRMKKLPYDKPKNIELDSILLIVAQMGVYFFSIFSIIAGGLSEGAAFVST